MEDELVTWDGDSTGTVLLDEGVQLRVHFSAVIGGRYEWARRLDGFEVDEVEVLVLDTWTPITLDAEQEQRVRFAARDLVSDDIDYANDCMASQHAMVSR